MHGIIHDGSSISWGGLASSSCFHWRGMEGGSLAWSCPVPPPVNFRQAEPPLHRSDKKREIDFFFAMPSILTWFFLNNINKAENWKHITPLNQRESERGKIKHWTTRQPQCSSVCLIALIKHLNVQCFRLSKVKFPEMPPKSTLTPLTTQKLFSFVKKSILKLPESWKDLLWLLFTCVSVGSGQPWDHTAPHRRVGVCGGGALGSGLGSPWAGQHRRTARPWCRIIRNCYIKTL